MKNNIDYQQIENGSVEHYINLTRYNDTDNWISLKELFTTNLDFIDMIFIKMTGKLPTKKEKRLLLRTLMVVSMGTGYHAPSVLVPRMVATTTKNEAFAIINGLIGGLTTIGTHHLGSVVHVMKMFKHIKDKLKDKNVKSFVEEYVNTELQHNRKIHGFGHPVYHKDPRPEILLDEIMALADNIYVDIYNCLAEKVKEEKNIFPNIDLILALSYLCLGFEPEHGIYLSFIARSLNMVCHILDELPKKPFAFLNEAVPLEKSIEIENEISKVNIFANKKEEITETDEITVVT